MRGWGSIGKQQTRIVFLALFSHIYIHTHPNKHETKQNWLTDNRQQMYTAHRRSRQLGNIIHKYIHQFMPRDGRIYIIQMEMGFIYNGCLFTGEAGKTNKTPLLVHRGVGQEKTQGIQIAWEEIYSRGCTCICRYLHTYAYCLPLVIYQEGTRREWKHSLEYMYT